MNLNFRVLLRTSALYLANQSVPNNRVFDAEFMTCRGMYVCASTITTGIPSTTPTAACGLPSTAITSVLVDGFYLKPKATARGLVTTDMQAPVSKIARIAFSLPYKKFAYRNYIEII